MQILHFSEVLEGILDVNGLKEAHLKEAHLRFLDFKDLNILKKGVRG